MDDTSRTLHVLRGLLLALVALGMVGMTVDLVLLSHFEGPTQLIPLVLLAGGLAVTAWHWLRPSPATVRALRAAMVLLALAGLLGFYFHFAGNRAFQLEMNPSLASWPLFLKAIQAHAPPALAPGALVQLALLGLIYCFRHPALHRPDPAGNPGSRPPS